MAAGSSVPRDPSITPEMRRFLDDLARKTVTFVGLPDKPTTLEGYGITDAERRGVMAGVKVKTASHVLELDDAGWVIEMNDGSPNTLTIPPESDVSFEIGAWVNITQIGAGQTTIVAGSGVTLRSFNSDLKLAGQGAMGQVYKRGTDEWVAGGNLVT